MLRISQQYPQSGPDIDGLCKTNANANALELP